MSALRLPRMLTVLALVLGALVAGQVAGAAPQGKPRIAATAPTAAYIGTSVTITGRASGAPAGQKVRLQRLADGRWRTLTTKKLSSGKPRKVTFRVTARAGTKKYRLALVARRGAPGATSNTVKLTGVPRADGAVEPMVQGNQLVDARTGVPWVPRGANWPDLEYSCSQGWKPSHSAADTVAMASWRIDLVRIPLNQDCWLGVDGAPKGEWTGATDYRNAVRQRVDWALDAGIAVILDLHRTGPAGVQAGDGQRAMADAQSIDFWASVAAAYKNEPSVMFELYNEPYNNADLGAGALSWSCWRDGGCQVDVAHENQNPTGTKYVVAGMAQLLAAVRGAGAQQPALLGGLNWANDLTQWLAHKPNDNQLVAAWHNYHGQGCNRSCWDTTIKSVRAQVPVLMTEFGYSTGDRDWMTKVMDWGDANDVGYLPWAWWELSNAEIAEDPSLAQFALLKPGTTEPRAPAGTTYYRHLQSLP